MSHRCELTSFVLHTLFIYLGWHTLYQPVDKQGKERGKVLPRFLAVFDTVSVAAVVRRTTAYTPPAARRAVRSVWWQKCQKFSIMTNMEMNIM